MHYDWRLFILFRPFLHFSFAFALFCGYFAIILKFVVVMEDIMGGKIMGRYPFCSIVLCSHLGGMFCTHIIDMIGGDS